MPKRTNNQQSSKNKVSENQLKAIRRNYAVKSANDKHNAQATKNDKFSTTESIDMHLARIPNKYMFKSDNSEGSHIYAVYKDNKTNEVRAIETTHLYVADKQNMDKVKNGLLYKTTFAGYETPSGVHNSYYNKGVDGKPINLNKAGIDINKTPLPYKQAKAIKEFAKSPRERDK